MPIYRPILPAKRGELTALGMLPSRYRDSLMPVLQAPPRDKDHARGVFKKSLEGHLTDLPEKLATATAGRPAYIDVSLLDNVLPIFGGVHPMTWLVEEADRQGLELTPFVGAGSGATTVSAATDIHARLGRGIALRLTANDWMTVDATRLPRLLSALSVGAGDVDLFIDAGRDFSAPADAVAELAAQDGALRFRSRTVGGAAFPDTQGLARGLTEFTRDDWGLFSGVHRARSTAGQSTPDFFDNVVNNPAVDVSDIDPRLLSISALFRYTADDRWVIAKGALFKGNGGKGIGAGAMIDPLRQLVAHAKYRVPISTDTDAWIDRVVAGVQNGSNAEGWRKWATLRHLQVVGHQLASPI